MSTTASNIPMSSQFIPQGFGVHQVLQVGQQQPEFPVKTFKVFGGIQICLGGILGILSVIGIKFLMYVVTGCLPMGMTKKRIANWRCLKTGFMVCSIIGASLFGLSMVSLGVAGSIMRDKRDSKAVVLSSLMAVLAFVEVVVAIITASLCCCCTAWGISNQQQGVLFMNGTQPGFVFYLQQNQIPMTTGSQTMIDT